ncbi:syncytin-A-like [Hyla sarda]|uniref:syncytin-A-like n=1 Tax=Hyla sarda TaxID=327740 RepID=UPI0024C29259|nr:syncytin-A-like [Hyla sarda]XP_056413682.1 syncytin-A-like [Hyla sarda]
MKYPLLTETPHSGAGIHIYPGNYTCYRGEKEGVNRKNFTKGYCASYSSVEVSLTQNQVFSIGDIYWICGDGKWKGECALAKAIMNIHIITEGGEHVNSATKRIKRSTPAGSVHPHVYIDTIGVPRGVPDEFKARSQVAAGFESILSIITVNKNVDWINYIYYNQQRFVNYTREALRGVAEQLQADSIMTLQNRMVLDMILAEKGGVCKVLVDPTTCCTFIPNTGPNGKVTIAIQKLEDLSAELKKNSGITDPWDQYFGWFTNWKHALTQLAIIIFVIIIVIAAFSLCVIPCIRRLLEKGVANATATFYQATPSLANEDTTPSGYMQYLKLYRERKLKKGEPYSIKYYKVLRGD